ncbi:peptidase [Streptomyces laurentii]|uniref:Peptidase n=1 Tax=Streptomyces laurentii TaxID=39478 RepID=A0A160P7Z6_STRLU|nr:peptidase [Streptomyces laurentii]
MPAKGKHRRRRIRPFGRGLAAASAGGAVVALPLIGATGAHAAEPAAVPRHAVAAAVPAAVPAAGPAATFGAGAPAKAYTVVRGTICPRSPPSTGWPAAGTSCTATTARPSARTRR